MTNEKELVSAQLAQLHKNNDAAQLTIRKKDEKLNCYQNKYGYNVYIFAYVY